MEINPWDFSPLVAAPYFAVFVLMLRLFFRKDGSGNKTREDNPFASTALILAGVALMVPAIFTVLRLAYVFVPYGSVWFGGAGLLFLGWAIGMQRRPPAPPVKSTELGPEEQKRAAAGIQPRAKALPPRRGRK